jgi:hypothetical protein
MLQNKKGTAGLLLLAGAAAYAYHKYSKMSEDEKNNMFGDLKEKGRKLYDQYVPADIKNMFTKGGTNMNAESKFGEGNEYVS